jgi:adenylate cyclase
MRALRRFHRGDDVSIFARHSDDLPPRVARLVAAETRKADVLAAWVVLTITGFLGILYLVSPKALGALMNEIKPVPIVVALFIIASLVRLWMARAGYTKRRVTFAFILIDFSLFYGLIWSFHLQYHQPATFYLKAPTFLFVFLFIAVRALRLEPWSVVAAGLTAAVGWAGMAAYAALSTPGMPVTRDFVTYLTSNMILVGAEVEKIVAILLVTLVLTLAIRRARRQLLAAAQGRTAQEDLSRFFPPEVAARIASGEEQLTPGRGESKHAAVLVCDLRGFTAFAATHPPADVMRVLVDYQRRIGAIIASHGGAIDKFLGDGILATFGCARPSETVEADAMRAGLAVADEGARFIASLNGMGPTGIGVAVTAGNVLFGTVGDAERLEFTVIGEPVNLATKLEKHNKRLGAAFSTDGDTYAQALLQGFDTQTLLARADNQSVEGSATQLNLVYKSA